MRRTLNLKMLAGSLAAFLLLAGGLYFLLGWQLSRLSQALLVLAENRESEGKWMEAATYLDRYLRVHSKSAEVQGRLATVYASGAKSRDEKPRAVALHYRALAANPAPDQRVELRAKLAELLFETQRFQQAE